MILLTTASGYVGSRLLRALEGGGDALWRLRGWLDARLGGAGMARHRPDPDDRTRSLAFAPRHRIVRNRVNFASPRRAHRWARAVALATAVTLQSAPARAQMPAPVRTVPFVDLDRYAGDWFEIARYPNRFQRQCVGDVRASYARRPEGGVDVVNRCRTADGQTEARGVARIVDTRTFAKLKVRFAPAWLTWLPMVWGDYWIVGLAPDYSWAVVGDPDRNYLWILARTPHLNDESMAAARAAARDNGFDIGRLVPTRSLATDPRAMTSGSPATRRIPSPSS